MKIFLSLKHWQLFLLIYCLPLALMIGMIGSMILVIGNVSEVVLLFYKLLLLSFIISIGIYFYWLWAIARFFYEKASNISEGSKLKFFLSVSFLCFVVVISILYFNINDWILKGNMEDYLIKMAIVMISSLLITISYLFSIYYVAKIFVTVKFGRTVSWTDVIIVFLLLWFYPIGIWIIQPQINKMFKNPFPQNPIP